MLRLDTPLTQLRGIGKVRFADLSREGMQSIEDLLLYSPIRYENRTQWSLLTRLTPDRPCLVRARVHKIRFFGGWRGKSRVLQVEICDGSGSAQLVFFNQPYLAKTFSTGASFYVYGIPKLQAKKGKLPVFFQPDFERIEDEAADSIHMGCWVPIYRRIGSCSSRLLRSTLHAILIHSVEWEEDPLPRVLIEKTHLLPRSQAMTALHFPELAIPHPQHQTVVEAAHRAISDEPVKGELAPGFAGKAQPERFPDPACILPAARKRLKFEEMFLFYVGLLERKRSIQQAFKPRPITERSDFREWVRRVLPFSLTKAQNRVVREILGDMAAPRPMCRLLQGDVGSGKTVVALLAVLAAALNGKQAALMVPTEVLAEQHFLTFERWLQSTPFRSACITSGVPAAARAAIARDLECGRISFVVGTQALIQESTRFKDLGLAIIDEQHRFGVLQRMLLGNKGHQPDILAMTATPIPRSLALTLYGDLDVSVLDELPPGRLPVRTFHCSESQRAAIYERIRQRVRGGQQVYFVCPLVQASSKTEVRDVERSYRKLAVDVFPEVRVGLLHGRMATADKLRILSDFQTGVVSVLVCTTVIEVGIDVPNATLMVIENAERFGLAQLHQIRGRVGRGTEVGVCVLLTSDQVGEEALGRLRLLCGTSDGFRIAEEDMAYRGTGEIAGLRQSGLSQLRFTDLLRDRETIEWARREALEFLESIRVQESAESARIVANACSLWHESQRKLSAG